MGVNPVTGGDRAVLIKEIKEGRRKACHDSPTFIPPLWISPLRLSSPGERGGMVLGCSSLPCPTATAVIQRFSVSVAAAAPAPGGWSLGAGVGRDG